LVSVWVKSMSPHVQLIAKEVLAETAGFGRGEETLGLGAEHGPIA
jgi:hypothetical protein